MNMTQRLENYCIDIFFMSCSRGMGVSQILLLMTCLFAGLFFGKAGQNTERSHAGLDSFVINLGLPCLIIRQIHKLDINEDLFMAVLMPWILFVVSCIIFWVVSKICKTPACTVGSLIITSGLSNTSIVGLPMIAAFYGTQDLPLGIMIGQFGTNLVLSTIGILIVCLCSGSTVSPSVVFHKIVKSPPFLSVLVALLFWDASYPSWADDLLRRMSETLAPVALFSIGLQLRLGPSADDWRVLAVGLIFKLFAGPAFVCLLYAFIFRCHPSVTRIVVFEAAMGPQIGAAIVGSQYGLNSILMARMVGIGTLLSFVTAPLWWVALRSI